MFEQCDLMKEIPSPNVTHILPDLGFGESRTIWPKPERYTILAHGQGVYELRPNLTYIDSCNIEQVLNKAFETYQTYDAVYPVTITGAKVDSDNNKNVGSTRFCNMDPAFATYLTNIIKDRAIVDIIKTERFEERHLGSTLVINHHKVNWWELVNVSQYFRFMKYVNGGEHFPHYDSDFEYEYNGAVTKYSLVVYFTDCDSGEIAFINDKSEHKTDCSDWTRQATNDEIWLKIKPSCMKIVLFPHTLCHTVLPFTDNNKIRYICRGDILFWKIK